MIEETNQLDDTRFFAYNAAGLLTRRIDRRARVRQFGYDNLYRNTQEIWYNSVADADADVNRRNILGFTYDTAGQMLTAADGSAEYAFEYDDLGRAVEIEQEIVGLTPVVIFAQEFDAAGRRTRLAADVGGTDDFETTYGYDNLGRADWIKQQEQSGGNAVADKFFDMAFDAAGQPEELLRYANLAGTQLVARTDWNFDGAGRLSDLTHKKDTTTFADYDWLYDVAGRISDFDFTSLVGQSGTADYTHDDTDQLTDADYNFQTDEDYVYDDNGNRTNNGYTVGSNNRLTSDGTYTYLYDAEGNRTARFIDTDSSDDLTTGDTDITEYTWDHRNRLTKVEHFATYADYNGADPDQIVEYTYDFGNRWVRKVLDSNGDGTPEGSTVFVQDGAGSPLPLGEGPGVRANQVLLQFDKTGTGDAAAGDLSHRYLWGPAVDQILADEEVDNLLTPGDVLWPLTDHLGSVRDLATYDAPTDTTTITNHRTYDAFGNITSETAPTVDHLFAFTGRALDEDTTLQNNLNRWYDAGVGRWLSEDPIGFAGGDANLYRYVRNRPIYYTDPYGLWKVVRRGALTAAATSEPGDTIDGLGHLVGLDPKDFRKWLTIPDGMYSIQVEPGTDFCPDHIESNMKLCPKQTLFIPNKVIAYWAGWGGWVGKDFVYWDWNVSYLRNRGFGVVELDHRAGRKLALEGELTQSASRKQLHGLYFWGHGIEPFPSSGLISQSGDVLLRYKTINLPYKMALGLVFACDSNSGMPFLSPPTPGRIWKGFTAVLVPFPPGDWAWVSSYLKPGNQGTNPWGPGESRDPES